MFLKMLEYVQHHLDDRGFILNVLRGGLNFVNRPYLITQLQQFLQCLRAAVNANKNARDY